MRNTGETDDDIKFRTALENMRYKACTKDDIHFLNTLVSANKSGRHFVGAAPWRDAPIIVGENRQKDEINRLGCLRFASDTHQTLFHFFSDDTVSTKTENPKQKTALKKAKKSKISEMTQDLQSMLWDLPTSSHQHHAPGKLSLCLGLPVIIRYNAATELNITKGQCSTVYAWHASKGKYGQQVLDVLFVLLDDPPEPVQVESLPLNVVPLTRRNTSGSVYLPDDSHINIMRNQVDVLPGFSMTAYASQGQSLTINATDLNTFSDHHSYYTALSWSRSAAKTVILQGFDPRHITGGATGSLRKEFRELEILNEITKLRYEGKLDKSVSGSTRNTLIEQYRNWKGLSYVPCNVHSAIRWSDKDPYIHEPADDIEWSTVDKKKFKKTKDKIISKALDDTASLPVAGATQHTSALASSKKRKRLSDSEHTTSPKKLKWSNNSCAYDSLFSIIRHTWREVTMDVSNYEYLPNIYSDFQSNLDNTLTFENIRDTFRLQVQHFSMLNWGAYSATSDVLGQLLRLKEPWIKGQAICTSGHISARRIRSLGAALLSGPFLEAPTSTSVWLNSIPPREMGPKCAICNADIHKMYSIQIAPPVIAFSLDGMANYSLDTEIAVIIANNQITYRLRGVSYFSSLQSHFVSRILDSQGRVFYHVGMSNGGNSILDNLSIRNVNMLLGPDTYRPSAAVYCKI
ncbi:hypothetical protein BDP27DRAFT_1542651 [Rhodocollybia butyracea]|uniref:Uncharacterized protein n=1 Tax=Rhodocollybia butyracea TaxID=206335 RepID=A0A9P5PQD5_9AGAR|nr:hypothetical protein BDP27DRAFT_1542651 [Rhodocollybia butyracea]